MDGGFNSPVVVFTWSRSPGDTGSNFNYRLYVQDFSRNAAALDVMTQNNYYAAHISPSTRYDALVTASPKSGGTPAQGPAQAFITRGLGLDAPTFTEPTVFSTVTRGTGGTVRVSWTPLISSVDGSPSPNTYEYLLSGPQNFRGTVAGTSVTLVMPPGTYTGIVRSCSSGTDCTAEPTRWGPWSNSGRGGSTSFTVQ
ncbi:MAG: hypothetical protein FJW39_30930 [Acidobacteria bacterium]|nr:hypothetical protein [Acidobacteriota bacterium]